MTKQPRALNIMIARARIIWDFSYDGSDCWPFPDDKACTFVGTAAYVPPEVLNSSPATFGYEYLLFRLQHFN